MVHTTLKDPLIIIQHHHGMLPWQHLCEYAPRFLSLRVPDRYKWWQLRQMKDLHLHCNPRLSKTWYTVHTTLKDPLIIIQHHHGMSPWQHLCEYAPRFLSLRVPDMYKWCNTYTLFCYMSKFLMLYDWVKRAYIMIFLPFNTYKRDTWLSSTMCDGRRRKGNFRLQGG